MTDKERDRIECAIRHIQTAVDVDPWAAKIAVAAMQKLFGNSEQLETHDKRTETHACDCISRQAALDAIKKLEKYAPTAQHLSAIFDCEDIIKALPPAQPTDRETHAFSDGFAAGYKRGYERGKEHGTPRGV